MDSLPLHLKLKILGKALEEKQNPDSNEGDDEAKSKKSAPEAHGEGNEKSKAETTSDDTDVIAVVMTKDRAFQLQECLRSILKNSTCGKFKKIYVLCHPGERFVKSYDKVQEMYSETKFLYDQRKGDFAKNLHEVVRTHSNDLICFLVDDMLFYRTFSFDDIKAIMGNPEVLAYQLNMHPGITYCHPSDKPAIAPSDLRAWNVEPKSNSSREAQQQQQQQQHQPMMSTKTENQQHCPKTGLLPSSVVFRRCLGSEDWNYPWNLCGGVYRGDDAMAILKRLKECAVEGQTDGANRLAFDHPNHLEVNGNKAVVELGLDSKRPFSACPALAVASVITINRVQDVYKNRIYSTKSTRRHKGVEEKDVELKEKGDKLEEEEEEIEEEEEEEEVEEEEEKGEAEMQSDSRNSSSDDPGSVQSLDSLLWKGFHFDLEAYKEMNPPPKSVHIGLLRVTKKKQRD